MYEISLSCGACHGQTARCLHERLCEHAYNVRNDRESFLAHHTSMRGCTPLFERMSVIHKHRDGLTHIILEVAQLAWEQSACISKPSIALSERELKFLGSQTYSEHFLRNSTFLRVPLDGLLCSPF